MRLLLLLIVLAAVAFAIYLAVSAHARRRAQAERWRVVTRTAEDGSLRVAVAGPGGERLVKELPPALDGAELTSELRLAREEAFLQAEELNRPAPGERRD